MIKKQPRPIILKQIESNSVKEIAKNIANKANMPYCWEDIEERLKKGYALPFKLID